jgi:two-component system chemotaxis response regulator CheB
VVVVLHVARSAPSALPAILGRAGPLPARAAGHLMPLRDGTIYVAPPDRHVLVVDDQLHLSAGPAENGHRPAIDPLFRSAAIAFGPRSVGVVLSGTRDDGTAGLVAILAQGGVGFVQEPVDALYDSMPRNALEHVPSAAAYPAAKLGGALAELLADPGRSHSERPAGDDLLLAENRIAAMAAERSGAARLAEAEPSALSCPSCDGVLFRLPGRPAPRFRCRVGHAWSPESLAAQQSTHAEQALWTALRALEEKASTLRWVADEEDRRGHPMLARLRRAQAGDAEADAEVLQRLLTRTGDGHGPPAGGRSGR